MACCNKALSLVIGLSLLAVQIKAAAIDEQDVKNDNGEIVFRVYDANKVKVANRHRDAKPPIKFSLHGTLVEKIERRNSSLWTLHLHDKSTADFSVLEKGANVTEYYLIWHGGGPNIEREVCFSYGYNEAKWFNAYQSMNASWPMDLAKTSVKQQFNFLFNFNRYYVTQNALEHLLILEQLYFTSDGFAILLDYQSPLFIRRTPNGDDPVMCFSVNNTNPYMEANTDPTYLDLKIHLFSSTNIRTVADFVIVHSGHIAKPTAVPDEKMFSYPNWFNWEMGQNDIDLANQIVQNGFPTKGKIVLSGSYETYQLDSMIKSEVYPQDSVISSLHDAKFEVAMQTHLTHLANRALTQKYFIEANHVDFSNPDSCKFLLAKLTNFRYEKQIDTFLLYAANVLSDFKLHDSFVQRYPSLFTSNYVETATQVGNTIISEFAFRTQHLPVWMRTVNYCFTPYDQLLAELIPTVLSVSIAGYSFVLPYALNVRPSEEQFVRWIQAVTFMPSIAFTALPWSYSAKVVELTKRQLNLHTEHVPVMLELAKRRITDGSPIIRPLWYVAPEEPKTYSIGDQYMLGDDILVAPVLKMGQLERSVYFPPGIWVDQHGKSYTGPSEAKVAAPLAELPYFKRKH